jgi:hypothetical protein
MYCLVALKSRYINRLIMLKITHIAIIFLLLFINEIHAQEAVSVSYNYGTIVIHNSSIKNVINGPVRGFSLNYSLPNKDGNEWRRLYNFPDYGLSYNFKSYHNPEILGDSHSLTGFFQMPFLRKGSAVNFGFKSFVGLGFFTKKYDPEYNPRNTAVSSHLNISAEGRLYGKIRIKPLFFEYSYGLNHLSNGLVKAPNLGLNVLNNSFSIGYELEKTPVLEKTSLAEYKVKPQHEFWIYGAIGTKEIDGMEQKRYVPVNASLNYSFKTSIINKMGVGLDFIYDPSLEDFANLNYEYQGSPQLNFRYGISLHNEFLFGRTGLFTSYGFYPKILEYYTRQRYYKVGAKFYFNNLIGVVLLRAIPLFRADVIEFGIGYSISKPKRSATQ